VPSFWRCGLAFEGDLALEEVLCEEEDVGGALGQAAHEVGVPLGAEWNVDADAEAFGSELSLQVAADAVEHLELEGGFGDVVFADEVAHGFDDGFVVGGEAAEDAFAVVREGGHALHQLNVVGVDVGLHGEGDLWAFLVGSLAEANANSLPQETLDVSLGAEEVRLEDGSDAAWKAGGEALGDGDGGLGVGRALHVDADEGVGLVGVMDHLADDALGEGGVEVHAHLRELYAYVRVEVANLDSVEELMVDVSGCLGLGFGHDALAKGVKADGDAFAVDPLAGGKGLLDRHAGYEAA
jgi:hypothetical protein